MKPMFHVASDDGGEGLAWKLGLAEGLLVLVE